MAAPSELAQRTVTALLWTYGGAVGRVLSQLVVQLLLARFLGPEAFGQAAAALLVHGLGWIFAEAGFGSALVQKEKISDDDVGYALGWVLMISGVIGLAVALASPWLAEALGGRHLQPLVLVCGLLIPVQAVGNIPASLMRRQLDAKRAQLIYLAGYVLCYGLIGLPLAMTGAGPWAVVAAFGAHAAFGLVASYSVVRHTLRPRLRGDAGLRRFGLQVTAANCTSWATENVDRALVGNLWGSASLGAYSAAYTLSRAPAGFLLGSLQPVIFAASSRVQDDRARLGSTYRGVLALAALLSWPLFIWMACHSNALIHLLYGDKWQAAGPLFMAFCAGLPFVALMTLTGPLLWSLNAVRQDVAAQVLALVCVVAGMLVLRGEALSSAVWLIPAVYALRAGWMTWALLRELRMPWGPWLAALRGGVLLAALAVGLSLASQSLMDRFGPLAAAAASALALALLAMLAVKIWPRGLMGADLVALLLARAESSAALARVCRWLGVQA